jgi:hypothetical protein
MLCGRATDSVCQSLCFVCYMLRNCAAIYCAKLNKKHTRLTKALDCMLPPTWLRMTRDWPKHVGGYCIVKWHLLVLYRISVVSVMHFVTYPIN